MKKKLVTMTSVADATGKISQFFSQLYQTTANRLVVKMADKFVGVREEKDDNSGRIVQSAEFSQYLQMCGKYAKADALVVTFMLQDCWPEVGFVINAECMRTQAEIHINRANTLNRDLAKKWGVAEFVQRDAEYMVSLMCALNYVTLGADGYVVTNEFWSTVPHSAVLPQEERCTHENRRFGYVAGGQKPSKTMYWAMQRLQNEAFRIDPIVEDLAFVLERMPHKFVADAYVINNSISLVNEVGYMADLFSEWGGDSRGRLYLLACASANSQTSDLARSLYSHTVENWVEKDSDAYHMFMAELEECAGTAEWASADTLTNIALDVRGYLLHVINLPEDMQPAKPFTLARVACDWYKFETEGKCDSRVSFGLDAKNSGTQYLAVLAGDLNISGATGITTGSDKVADPYVQSLNFLKKNVSMSNFKLDMGQLNRSLVKTPYMAIQYRGTVQALLNSKDWVEAMEKTGLFEGCHNQKTWDERARAFSEMMVASIYEALGPQIINFIEELEEAVRYILVKHDITHFDYKMSDGFVVHKPCYKKWMVDAPEAVRVDLKSRVIFGDMKQDKPWQVRDAKPSGEEFIRTFMVNFIQGIDALVCRTFVKYAQEAGIRGITVIHDCFRSCLGDAPKLKQVIADVYMDIFVGDGSSVNRQLEHLRDELVAMGAPTNLFAKYGKMNGVCGMDNESFKDCMYHENSYYFCQ